MPKTPSRSLIKYVEIQPVKLLSIFYNFLKHQFSICFIFKDLLNENRWTLIANMFKQDNYKIHQLSEQSSFLTILQAGLSALKTPTCYRKVTAVKNLNCPVCHRALNLIGRPLPYAYCSNSKLICAYSGQSINENNPPMMLPNGHVYSYNVSVLSVLMIEVSIIK